MNTPLNSTSPCAHNLPLVDNYPAWLKLYTEDLDKYQKRVPDGIWRAADL